MRISLPTRFFTRPVRLPTALFPGIICLAAATACLPGCRKPDEIVSYTIPKPPVREGKPAAADQSPVHGPGDATDDQDGARDHLLGAIIPRGTQTWFFKLTGPSDAVKTQMKAFVQFIKSVRFSEKGPEWGLPEGWKEEPGSAMRFATLRIETDAKPLEMSVIPLPTGAGSIDEYLLSNVNRWRGQMGLGPLPKEGLDNGVIKFDLDDTQVWLVSFEGRMSEQPMGGAPFAGKGGGPRTVPTPPDRSSLPFTSELPEGWKPTPAGQMQLATFEVRDGGRQATISVSTAGGDLVANINRWRGQVQLDPAEPAEIENQMRKIDVGGNEGALVELVGPESAQPRKSILGVVVEAQGRQWFIKLLGDAALAEREKKHFEEFVQSIRFRPVK